MDVIEFFLSGVCHQLPEHSFHYGGRQLPLCARCTGTFLGVVLGLLVLAGLAKGRARWLPPCRSRAVLAALIGAWGLDGTNSFVHWVTGRVLLYEPNNSLRLFTGVGLGLAIAAVLYPIAHYAASGAAQRDDVPLRGVLTSGADVSALLGAGVLVAGGFLAWRGAPFGLVAGLAVGSVAVTLSLVNGILLALVVRPASGAALRAWMPAYLAAGLALGTAETGLMAALRRLLIG